MPPIFRRRLGWAALLCCAVVAVSLMWLVAIYQFPRADDFCRIVQGRSAADPIWFRVFRLTAQTYLTWSGRWTSFLVYYLVLGSLDMLKYYPYALLVLAALQLLAIVGFFRYVLELSGARSWLAGTLFYAVLVTVMPRPQDGIYWFTGSVEYQFTFTTALVLFTCVRLAPDKPWSNALICLAAIAVCGQHELAAFCVFVVFAGVWTVKRVSRDNSLRFLLFAAAGAAGLAITVLARGNFVRATWYHGGRVGVIVAAFQLAKLLLRFVSDPRVILAAFLWTQFALDFKRRTILDLLPGYRPLAPFLTIGFFLLIVVVPTAVLGHAVPRANNLAFTVLLLGTTLSIFLFRFRLAACAAPGLRTAAAVTLACALLASPNAQQARAALKVSPLVWRQRMVARLSAQGPDVLMPLVQPPSPLVDVPGVWAAERDAFPNPCVADFMHVRSVTAPPEASIAGSLRGSKTN